MQWGIGFANGSVEDVIKNKSLQLNFKWLPRDNNIHFIADPFIFKNKQGNINLLYEDFSIEKDGFISLKIIDNNFELVFQKQLLKTESHLSYPFVFLENGITYIIPESSKNGQVSVYEYEHAKNILIYKKLLVDLPLLDSTIVKYNSKYWLFATLNDGIFENSKLYIYHSDTLLGEYKPHVQNPVRHNLNGTRPAGNFITVDGELYRPAQNCLEYYGKSISIKKIISLTIETFEEEHYFDIIPNPKSIFNAGLHTINAIDNVIVIDGIRFQFKPFTKAKLFFKKKYLKFK